MESKTLEEGEICPLCRSCDVGVLPLEISAPGSQASKLGLNYTSGFAGFPAHRQHSAGLLGLHNHVS